MDEEIEPRVPTGYLQLNRDGQPTGSASGVNTWRDLPLARCALFVRPLVRREETCPVAHPRWSPLRESRALEKRPHSAKRGDEVTRSELAAVFQTVIATGLTDEQMWLLIEKKSGRLPPRGAEDRAVVRLAADLAAVTVED